MSKVFWYICGVDVFKILKWYLRFKYYIFCIKYIGYVICDWWKGYNFWWDIKFKFDNFYRKDDLCIYKYIFINLNYVIFYYVIYNDIISIVYIIYFYSLRLVIYV